MARVAPPSDMPTGVRFYIRIKRNGKYRFEPVGWVGPTLEAGMKRVFRLDEDPPRELF